MESSTCFISSPGIGKSIGFRRSINGAGMSRSRAHQRSSCIVAIANPMSPTGNGVAMVDRGSGAEDAFRVWEQCIRDDPDKGFLRIKDDVDDVESTKYVLLKERGRVIAAGRLHREGQNVRLSKIAVIPGERGKGYGKRLVQGMLSMCSDVEGVVYVKAHRWELGFYYLLGFDSQGGDDYGDEPQSRNLSPERSVMQFTSIADMMDESSLGAPTRTMVYRAEGVENTIKHHVALKANNIERSLGFYGAIGFTVTEKYFSSGKRVCKMVGFGTTMELEEEGKQGKGRSASSEEGRNHDVLIPSKLVFDVTKLCTDLPGYLRHLQKMHGGGLHVVTPPKESFRGRNVIASATILDPDSFPLEFQRFESRLPESLAKDMSW
ncbi:hypothetical protein NDN08_000916 [Rhodosorus marinus]|uniref:N-acetyltransferase domain-containing protein n=1 Tax=Rhodosorus marinus TaxID=101924 RepID=A0AAV8USY4_9RHOD|nr:hypothetical protein NDN08_000916 [Rhodosorus marinus]